MDISSRIDSARSCAGVPFSQVNFPFSSLGDLLDRQSEADPSRTWLTFHDEDGTRTEYSYGDFRNRVARVAAYMERLGLRTGDRVATVAHNHADTVVQYFAAWWLGLTLVPINIGEDDPRIVYILNNSRCRLVFVRSEYASRVDSFAHELTSPPRFVLVGEPDNGSNTGAEPAGHDWDRFHSLFDAEGAEPVALPPARNILNQECLIVYTSGTTGHPKGVVLCHGNLLADADGIRTWHNITPEAPMMCVLPIHHVNGTVVTLVTPLYAGSRVVLCRKYQSGKFFQRIAEEGVEVVSVVPTLLAFLLQADISTTELDLSHFRHIICGAGPLTCELARRFEDRYGIPIVHGYGLSETTCYSCFLPINLDPATRRHWLLEYGFPSIGPPIPQNEMDIQNDLGISLAEGERGEIVIRGHNVMLGYYNNPEANDNAFTWGWFRSGDEGFFQHAPDGERYFFITGRIKELIIRGGVNVSPLEIDEVLNRHPKVDAAIAVGFDNTWYGEEIGAYVRRIDATLTEADVISWCREHLPFFKSPKVVLFGEDIPVTSTGKYQRNRIKHLFADYRDRQFHG